MCSEPEIKLNLALFFFQEDLFTLAQASEFAGICRLEFQQELGKRKIPVHYDEVDLERDWANLRSVFGDRSK
jgi:predicted HTH domain antitoxin